MCKNKNEIVMMMLFRDGIKNPNSRTKKNTINECEWYRKSTSFDKRFVI